MLPNATQWTTLTTEHGARSRESLQLPPGMGRPTDDRSDRCDIWFSSYNVGGDVVAATRVASRSSRPNETQVENLSFSHISQGERGSGAWGTGTGSIRQDRSAV